MICSVPQHITVLIMIALSFCSRSKDGAFVKAPNAEKTKQIYQEIKEWQVVSSLMENRAFQPEISLKSLRLQHSHNAIYEQNSQNYSAKMLSFLSVPGKSDKIHCDVLFDMLCFQ